MIDTVRELIYDYFFFIEEDILLEYIDARRTEIRLPFLNCYGERILIYVTEDDKKDTFIISDNGETLAISLLNLTARSKSNNSINKICNIFRITRTKTNELKVVTTEEDFPSKLFNFIQAILAIDAGSRFV